MIATVLLIPFSHQTRNIEIRIGKSYAAVFGVFVLGSIGATFCDQEIDELAHHVVVGVTDERGCFPTCVTRPATTNALMWWERVEGAIFNFSCRRPTGNRRVSPARISVR